MSQSEQAMAAESMAGALEDCIQNCIECNRTCMETFTYCLHTGGDHANPDLIRLLLDCAQICQTSADFMIRESALHPRICGVCADICGLCATRCAEFKDDPEMELCAEVCRRCDDSCRHMAGAA